MSGYFIKAQDAQTDYAIDWAQRHLRESETVAADEGWTIVPADPDGGLAIVSEMLSGTISKVVLGAGEPGKLYVVTAKMLTSDARVLTHSVAVRVAAEV